MPTPKPRSRTHTRSSKKRPLIRPLNETRLAEAAQEMGEPSGTARFAAGKRLRFTAEKYPARVYPHFDAIAALLDSGSKIMRWTAMLTLASLAEVDADRKIDVVVGRYAESVRGSNLISAANAIKCLARIIRPRPDLVERVIPAILDVERATYETPECRNVAIGQALDALAEIDAETRARSDVVAFILRQRSNPRAAVARRAKRLLPEGDDPLATPV